MTQRDFSPVRDLSRIATFAAIIAVLGMPGQIPLFGGVIPITLQTLGVMLAGAVLGWWRGAASVILLLLLVAAGLPLLAGGRGGIGVFFGPSAGYLLGWVVGAAVVGLIVQLGARRVQWWRVALGSVVGGILVVYAFGSVVLSLNTGLALGEAALGNALFLPGDAIKAVVTTLLAVALWKAYPAAFTLGRGRRAADAAPAAPSGHEAAREATLPTR